MTESEISELEELLERRPRAWFWVSDFSYEEMVNCHRERGGETVRGDWWTCDPEIEKDEVAFAYVASPDSGVIAVKTTSSPARQLDPGVAPEFDVAGSPAWVCDWRFVGTLSKPLPFKALRIDPVLAQEHGVQVSFNGRSFPCSPEGFEALMTKLIRREKKALDRHRGL